MLKHCIVTAAIFAIVGDAAEFPPPTDAAAAIISSSDDSLFSAAAPPASGYSPHQLVRYFNASHTVVEAENFTTTAASCRAGQEGTCVCMSLPVMPAHAPPDFIAPS